MSKAENLSKNEVYDFFPEIKARYKLAGSRAIGSPSGFGAVWKAHDKWLGVDVAIKISDSDLSSEVKLCRQIDRETVRVFEYFRSGDWNAYAMELLASPWMSMSSMMDNRKSKKNDIRHYFDSFEIVNGLLHGISSVHGASHASEGRFIHADIKPDNVFVRIAPKKRAGSVFRMPAPEALVKIIDLGVSVERGNALQGWTKAYSPPSATTGSPGVDLYAVAICFLEVITGERPSHADMAHKARIRALVARNSSGSQFIDDVAVDFAVMAKNAFTQRGTTAKKLMRFLEERLFGLYPLMLLSVKALVEKGPLSKQDMVDELFPVFAQYLFWVNKTQGRRDEIAAHLDDWRACGLIVKQDGENKYSV